MKGYRTGLFKQTGRPLTVGVVSRVLRDPRSNNRNGAGYLLA